MAIRAGAIMRGMDLLKFIGGGTLGNATAGSSHSYAAFGTKLVNVLHPEQEEEKDYATRVAARGAEHRFDMEKPRQAVRIERKDIPSAESYGGPCWDFGWRTSFRGCSPKNFSSYLRLIPGG